MTGATGDQRPNGGDDAGDAARDDWARYGGAHAGVAPGTGSAGSDRSDPNRDNPFIEYRYEAGEGLDEADRAAGRARRRRKANLLGLLAAAGDVALAAVLFNFQASTVKPSPSPSGGSIAVPSPTPYISVAPTIRQAHVGVSIQLPLPVLIPARNLSPMQGGVMYLAVTSGALSSDPGSGRILRVYGGTEYPTAVRKAIVDDGLWVSIWPSNYEYCGPDCWPTAGTYRLDLETGAVTATLSGAFLIGASFDGVLVASNGTVLALDPATAEVRSTLKWTDAGEPRYGCSSLWSFENGGVLPTVALVNTTSGNTNTPVDLPNTVTYGPITVSGQCWMMSGSDGASAGPTSLVWLSPSGSSFGQLEFVESVVVLDTEFWTCFADGSMQRLEAVSGVHYGTRYEMPVKLPDGDPKGLFAADGTLWMVSGSELTGFDMPTGTSPPAR